MPDVSYWIMNYFAEFLLFVATIFATMAAMANYHAKNSGRSHILLFVVDVGLVLFSITASVTLSYLSLAIQLAEMGVALPGVIIVR